MCVDYGAATIGGPTFCPRFNNSNMTEEIWGSINNPFGENYSVSNLGNVRRNRDNHIIAFYINVNGYKTVTLYKDGVGKSQRVHRLVAEAFVPNPENKRCVNHKDGDKLNNSADNLEWCTSSENNAHAYRMGLKRPSFGNAVVDKSTVLEIRRKFEELNKTRFELAAEYNLNKWVVNAIIARRSWNHI